MKYLSGLIGASLFLGVALAADIEPTWESMAQHYQVPAWAPEEL